MSEFSDAPIRYQPEPEKVRLNKKACDSIYDLISTAGISLSFKVAKGNLKDVKE